MKRYILLGIGIGIIFTNIVLSFVHGNKVDIDKIVEAEVQKRLKNIETYQKVEESFKEVVKDDKGTTLLSSESGIEIDSEAKVLFPGETGPGAIYYLYFYNTNVEKDLMEITKKVEELLLTKIEKKSNRAYLFSENKYTQVSINELIEIVKKEYNLKARRVTEKERQELMEVSIKKTVTKTKTVPQNTTVNTTTTQSLSIKTEQVLPKKEEAVKEIIKEEAPKEIVKEVVVPKE